MIEEGEKPLKKEPQFPDVTDPKLFGHEGDARIEEERIRNEKHADTLAELYGHPDEELDRDRQLENEKTDAEKEQDELSGLR